MLKKSGALLLTMLYIITVVGFALNLQYCGKIITDVKINAPLQGCFKSQMATKMKCCTQKQFNIKIKDAHESGLSSVLAKVFAFNLPHVSLSKAFLFAPQFVAQNVFYNKPPSHSTGNVSLLVKNCIFRI